MFAPWSSDIRISNLCKKKAFTHRMQNKIYNFQMGNVWKLADATQTREDQKALTGPYEGFGRVSPPQRRVETLPRPFWTVQGSCTDARTSSEEIEQWLPNWANSCAMHVLNLWHNLSAIVVVVVGKGHDITAIMISWCVCLQCENLEKTSTWIQKIKGFLFRIFTFLWK